MNLFNILILIWISNALHNGCFEQAFLYTSKKKPEAENSAFGKTQTKNRGKKLGYILRSLEALWVMTYVLMDSAQKTQFIYEDRVYTSIFKHNLWAF